MTKSKPRQGPKPKKSQAALARRAGEICRRLVREYPDARCRLTHASPFELLVATILSAQCTDDRVNRVTPALFKKASTPEAFARMPLTQLETAIRSTGFYHNKARSISGMSKMLVQDFGGRVPVEMADLLKLPGVARKTANVLRSAAYGLPAIIVDTHFIRLSGRMGLTKNEKPEKIEADVCALLPKDQWSAFSHAILFHGRAVCNARKPACDRCVVSDLCPSALKFPHFEKGSAPGSGGGVGIMAHG
jgi:endonuclease III